MEETIGFMFPMFVGLIATAMFVYGWNAGRKVPFGAGLALMIVPLFISNMIILLLVAGGLAASPWIIRE